MRVFISHQHMDTQLALSIGTRLRTHHQIESYVDAIDPSITRGEDLAIHIRSRMAGCTQLLAVVSYTTKDSQWVPWEIGVATEKDFPLATYSSSLTAPPEFLQKWPYLRSMDDLDAYARASKMADGLQASYNSAGRGHEGRSISTKDFYRSLRASLRQ